MNLKCFFIVMASTLVGLTSHAQISSQGYDMYYIDDNPDDDSAALVRGCFKTSDIVKMQDCEFVATLSKNNLDKFLRILETEAKKDRRNNRLILTGYFVAAAAVTVVTGGVASIAIGYGLFAGSAAAQSVFFLAGSAAGLAGSGYFAPIDYYNDNRILSEGINSGLVDENEEVLELFSNFLEANGEKVYDQKRRVLY